MLRLRHCQRNAVAFCTVADRRQLQASLWQVLRKWIKWILAKTSCCWFLDIDCYIHIVAFMLAERLACMSPCISLLCTYLPYILASTWWYTIWHTLKANAGNCSIYRCKRERLNPGKKSCSCWNCKTFLLVKTDGDRTAQRLTASQTYSRNIGCALQIKSTWG